MKFPKSSPVRSESYRRFIATFPCFSCGVEGFSQAAHANVGKGLGMKTSDLETFPLCGPHWGLPGCHYLHDNLIDMDREERRWIEGEYIKRMQAIAKAAGRREFKEAA